MEYVQGQTLLDRINQGPLPLGEVLQIAGEVAEAETAHRQDIVHRDLKPANITLTDEGHAKVMDFGLAKKVVREDGTEQDITATLTLEGSTLGTLAYMSPGTSEGRTSGSPLGHFLLWHRPPGDGDRSPSFQKEGRSSNIFKISIGDGKRPAADFPLLEL